MRPPRAVRVIGVESRVPETRGHGRRTVRHVAALGIASMLGGGGFNLDFILSFHFRRTYLARRPKRPKLPAPQPSLLEKPFSRPALISNKRRHTGVTYQPRTPFVDAYSPDRRAVWGLGDDIGAGILEFCESRKRIRN